MDFSFRNPLSGLNQGRSFGNLIKDIASNVDVIPGVDNPFNNKPKQTNTPKQQGQVKSDRTTIPSPGAAPSGPLPADQAGGSGGGRGGAAASGYSPADIALIEAGIGNANSGLGLLDQQNSVGQGNINSNYNSALNTLLGSRAQAEQQYGTSKTRAQQDNLTARNDIDASVGRNANALQRLLGSRGAGNSSAAQVVAPYAAAFQGTQQRTGVERDYSRDMADLDTNYNTFNTQWGQSREDLDRQKFQQEQALKSDVAGKRQSLLSTLAELNAKKVAGQGGSSGAALAAAQPYLSQANNISGQIIGLGAQYASPINVQAPTYTQGEVGDYQYDTSLGASAPNTSAYTDTVSPAYSTLLNGRRRQNGMAF